MTIGPLPVNSITAFIQTFFPLKELFVNSGIHVTSNDCFRALSSYPGRSRSGLSSLVATAYRHQSARLKLSSFLLDDQLGVADEES